MFSPLNDNEIYYINFVDPGDVHVSAKVTGFGAVFTDVDSGHSAKMDFLDEYECKLVEVNVPAEASGLSFLGVIDFGDEATVATVKITLGDLAIGDVHSGLCCWNRRGVVVMYDFI
jgi:hypothetical protein